MEEKKFGNKLSKGMGRQALGSCREEVLPALSLKHMGVLGVHFSILISTSSICS